MARQFCRGTVLRTSIGREVSEIRSTEVLINRVETQAAAQVGGSSIAARRQAMKMEKKKKKRKEKKRGLPGSEV